MSKDKELEEAGEFVKELYEFTYLDDMIKDFKEKDERDDEEFLSWLIWFRGQVLDFIEKHAKKDEPEKAQDKELDWNHRPIRRTLFMLDKEGETE